MLEAAQRGVLGLCRPLWGSAGWPDPDDTEQTLPGPPKLPEIYRGQTINANFFAQSFSTTLRVMDVRAENRGRPHQKVRFSAALVVGRNFLTLGHPGVRVSNVRGKSGPKSLCLRCFFFPEFKIPKTGIFGISACLLVFSGYLGVFSRRSRILGRGAFFR